jgi:hypothetical protein
MGLFAKRNVRDAAFELQPPAGDPYKSGDHAQQGGFSGAIAAGHHHGLAAGQGEAEAAENVPPATVAGQLGGTESRHGCRGPFAGVSAAGLGLENPDFPSIFGEVPRSI